MQKNLSSYLRKSKKGSLSDIGQKPEEVNAVSGSKPKDPGTVNSLQVAIKSGHLDVQTYSLIEEQILTLLKEPTG